MTDKRDLLLTLVFLKFIGERFKRQKEKIRHEIVEVQGIHDEAFAELQLSRPNQYMQDGVFFLTDETFWDKLILTAPTGMAIAFDTAIKTLDDNEPKLKNALPQQIFTKTLWNSMEKRRCEMESSSVKWVRLGDYIEQCEERS